MNLTAKRRRGAGYLELLVAVILLVIAATGAYATWAFSVKAPANKRVTEMGVYLGSRELERLKAQKYGSLVDTSTGSPNVTYYDKYGASATGATTGGYKVKSWVTTLVDRDAKTNTEDLREVSVEVWDSGETKKYETARTLLTFGGL